MQRAVPDVVERLVQLLGRILVEINQNNLMSVECGSPEERQIVAQPHQRFCERIAQARESQGRGRQNAPRDGRGANEMLDLTSLH